MQPRRHRVRPERPAAELTDDDLRELGRRLFDEITIDRLEPGPPEDEKDLEDKG